MPQLFTLPYAVPLSTAGILLPGAKLTFTQTASSTPQPVYQDIDLTTPHPQPIEADGAGQFPAIYLDPSLPDYRVSLTDSGDVLLPGYPIDDVPSNQNVSQVFRLKATAPTLIFEETDASSGNQKCRIQVNNEQFTIDLGSDDEGTWVNLLTLTRSGTTPNSLNFAGQFLRVNNVLTATQENSTAASATLTGCTTSPTGAVMIRRSGTKVALSLPALSATSNSTALSLTGLGSLNFSNGGVLLCRVIDNGTTQLGTAAIGTNSITFGVGASGGSFTNSGTKGFPTQLLIFDTDLASVA